MRANGQGRARPDAPPRGDAERILRRAGRYLDAGRLDEARVQYRRLLEIRPGDPDASHALGLIAGRAGDPAAATPHLVAALRGSPDRPAHWAALAASLIAADRLPDARALLDRFRGHGFTQAQVSAVLKPIADALYESAARHHVRGEAGRAEALLDLLIMLDDAHVAGIRLAAAIAGARGDAQRAVDLLTIAVYRDPADAAAFRDLGGAFSGAGDRAAAIGALEKAVALDPGGWQARSDLADLYIALQRVQDALPHLEAIVAAEPGRASAHNNLAFALMQLGRADEALAHLDRTLALAPDEHRLHSNRLLLKLYLPTVAPEDYIVDARVYGRRVMADQGRARAFANPREPERRLRVGFVSADLRHHAVACFLEPFLDHLDRAAIAPVAYGAGTLSDSVTDRLKPKFALWRDVSALDDAAAAALIEADAIDILVDLSGHSAGNRLPVFARRPAPVQATWIGYPGSTGLPAIDYRITDHAFEPEGSTDRFHSETLWRLPGVTMSYRPIEAAPEPAARAPFETNGYVTLGCLNRLAKVGPEALTAWARILDGLPDARLFLVAADVDDPQARAAVAARLAEAGLPAGRTILAPRVPAGAHFGLFDRIDIALDPFPHNGGTTSYETLLMGVPLVSLRGTRTPGRLGAAILEPMGLGDLVTDGVDAYVARVCALAGDREALAALRSSLRGRMLAGPHMDHARHAAEVGAAFRAMWRLWLAGPG